MDDVRLCAIYAMNIACLVMRPGPRNMLQNKRLTLGRISYSIPYHPNTYKDRLMLQQMGYDDFIFAMLPRQKTQADVPPGRMDLTEIGTLLGLLPPLQREHVEVTNIKHGASRKTPAHMSPGT